MAVNREERHKVVLEVRFQSAEHFVSEYAENLSVGGLFVRDAVQLEPLSHVRVEFTLPGHGTFSLVAKVAHILSVEIAEKFNRRAGAGLQLLETPDGFDAALIAYLSILGKRRDMLVLAEDASCVAMVQSAGYLAEEIEVFTVMEQSLRRTDVLAIVTHKDSAQVFRDALSSSPKKIPVIGCDCSLQEDLLLKELDRLAVKSK